MCEKETKYFAVCKCKYDDINECYDNNCKFRGNPPHVGTHYFSKSTQNICPKDCKYENCKCY